VSGQREALKNLEFQRLGERQLHDLTKLRQQNMKKAVVSPGSFRKSQMILDTPANALRGSIKKKANEKHGQGEAFFLWGMPRREKRTNRQK